MCPQMRPGDALHQRLARQNETLRRHDVDPADLRDQIIEHRDHRRDVVLGRLVGESETQIFVFVVFDGHRAPSDAPGTSYRSRSIGGGPVAVEHDEYENMRLAFADEPAEHDIATMVAMLDYLIAEISRIDIMSAQCLILARKSLVERIAGS